MKHNVKFGAALLLASLVYSPSDADANDYEYSRIAAYDECSSTQVFLSCPSYTWDFQFRALYLQPSGSNLTYAAETQPLPVTSPDWIMHDIRPDFHFGFDVAASAICCDLHTDFTFTWSHFYSKDTTSTHVASTDIIGPLFEIGTDVSPYTRAHGKAIFDFDAFEADYGVFVNFGDRLKTNIFGGLAAASVKETLFSRYSNLSDTIVRTIKAPSRFTGGGPQIGVDFAYSIWDGFCLTGEADAAILVGSLKNHTSFSAISPALAGLGITPPNLQSTTEKSRTQVVPAFKGRLGLSYSFTVCDCFNFNLECGYQARVYINAVQSMDIGSEVIAPSLIPDTTGVFARTFNRTLSNFALAGPYLTLNVRF